MYDASGNPVWYLSGQAPMTDPMTYIGTWSQLGHGQTLTGSHQPPTTVNSNVGPVTIRFSDTQNATLTLPMEEHQHHSVQVLARPKAVCSRAHALR